MTTDVHQEEFTGRALAPIVGTSLAATAVLALLAGLIAFGGSSVSGQVFAWGFASPVGAALFGAALLGAVPLLSAASGRDTWEQARIALLPATLLILGFTILTLSSLDDLAFSGSIVSGFMAVAWLLAMIGLSVLMLVALVAQFREPAFPLARVAPLPRWTVPLVALVGSAYFGLGLGLLVQPSFWGEQLPFDVTTLDARALGVWALTIGGTLLGALAEDDLDRVAPGLIGITVIGVLALAAVAWRFGDVDWTAGLVTLAFVGLLAALPAIGLIGLALRHRALADG
jgi:hypothetical protein